MHPNELVCGLNSKAIDTLAIVAPIDNAHVDEHIVRPAAVRWPVVRSKVPHELYLLCRPTREVSLEEDSWATVSEHI